MEVDLWCPQCEERVLDMRKYTEGQQQRATCPQCHVELVRRPDLAGSTWKVEEPTPLADDELHGGE
jgi:Zn finger protein HypA/HybF involved in hydrogenase expression